MEQDFVRFSGDDRVDSASARVVDHIVKAGKLKQSALEWYERSGKDSLDFDSILIYRVVGRIQLARYEHHMRIASEIMEGAGITGTIDQVAGLETAFSESAGEVKTTEELQDQ